MAGKVMVYRNEHNCDRDCTRLVAYVRIEGKWEKIGSYGSKCKKFEDLQQEEKDRLDREKLNSIKLQIRQAKQEGRATLNAIKNMRNSFLK
jgi:hypothetical protein